jgi:hypothetical protein
VPVIVSIHIQQFPIQLQNDQTSPGPEDDVGDMADSVNWRKLWKFRSDKDSVENQKRKEEKKAQADEKRRIKEMREEVRCFNVLLNCQLFPILREVLSEITKS